MEIKLRRRCQRSKLQVSLCAATGGRQRRVCRRYRWRREIRWPGAGDRWRRRTIGERARLDGGLVEIDERTQDFDVVDEEADLDVALALALALALAVALALALAIN